MDVYIEGWCLRGFKYQIHYLSLAYFPQAVYLGTSLALLFTRIPPENYYLPCEL